MSMDCISGLERLDTLGLSVITDDGHSSLDTDDTNNASEPLVMSPSAAGSLSPSNVVRELETQVTDTESTSLPPSQRYAFDTMPIHDIFALRVAYFSTVVDLHVLNFELCILHLLCPRP